MKKMAWEIILLAAFVVVLAYIIIYNAKVILSPVTPQSPANSICIGKNCFMVELAKNEAEKEQGLMAREHLDEDKGMLFFFAKDGIYPFWMKYTLIPLDMVWIDADGKVVFIKENAQPCKGLICPQIVPSQKARYVLEINAGLCKKLGIKVGDQAKLKLY